MTVLRQMADRDRLLTMLAERAYQYRPEQPFTLSSGALSDYYLDARAVTWDPEAKPLIGALVFAAIAGRADAAGGLTLGADPIAGAVAYYSQIVGAPIRAFTVRKQAGARNGARDRRLDSSRRSCGDRRRRGDHRHLHARCHRSLS
jgi:orotate phosphoribosyltransferase